MKKFFVLMLVMFFALSVSVMAAPAVTKLQQNCHDVRIQAAGFGSAITSKTLYLNGTAISSFNKWSSATQTKDLTLPVGVNNLFVMEGDVQSNTLTVNIIGNWKNGLSMAQLEAAGYIVGETVYNSNIAAGSYIVVTAYAKDVMFLNAQVSADKEAVMELVVGGTADAGGNTVDVTSSAAYGEALLQSESMFEFVPAGTWVKVYLKLGTTGNKYIHWHKVNIEDWAKVEYCEKDYK